MGTNIFFSPLPKKGDRRYASQQGILTRGDEEACTGANSIQGKGDCVSSGLDIWTAAHIPTPTMPNPHLSTTLILHK